MQRQRGRMSPPGAPEPTVVSGGEARLDLWLRRHERQHLRPSLNDGQGSARDDGSPLAAKFAHAARMLAASACWAAVRVAGNEDYLVSRGNLQPKSGIADPKHLAGDAVAMVAEQVRDNVCVASRGLREREDAIMNPSENLTYDVFVNDPPPQDGLLPNGEPKLFSPMASTLIYGTDDAVLTDPGMTADQARVLGDWVVARGRNLTDIFITHGHGDHWFAAGLLAERFGARVVASAGTIAQMHANLATRPFLWDEVYTGIPPRRSPR